MPKLSGIISFEIKKGRHLKVFVVLVEKISAQSDVPCLRNRDDSAGFSRKSGFEKTLTE
jgi:hypothetical protein